MELYIEGIKAAVMFNRHPHRAGQMIIETVGTPKEDRTLEALRAWRDATAEHPSAYETFTTIIDAMEAR